MRLRTRLIATSVACIVITGAALLAVHYVLLSRTFEVEGASARRNAEIELRLSPGSLGGSRACPDGTVSCEASEPDRDSREGRVVKRAPEPAEIATEVQDRVTSQVLSSTVRWSLLLLGLLAVLGGGAAFFIGRRIASPIESLTKAAQDLSTDRLHERVSVEGTGVETDELARSFNGMLTRLDASFTAQRRFVVNASHQLKTPLAIMKTQIDVARRTEAAPVSTPLLTGIERMVDRMDLLIEAMLRLAKAERAIVRGVVDLEAVVQEVVDQRGSRVDLVHLQLEPCEVPGDRELLREAVSNLLDNATLHGEGPVAISLGPEGDSVSLKVENPGPLIAPDQVAELFEPFRQLEGQRTSAASGYGLGLSVVRAIVEAHHGEVTATAIPSGGLSVVVRLPAHRVGSDESVPTSVATSSHREASGIRDA